MLAEIYANNIRTAFSNHQPQNFLPKTIFFNDYQESTVCEYDHVSPPVSVPDIQYHKYHHHPRKMKPHKPTIPKPTESGPPTQQPQSFPLNCESMEFSGDNVHIFHIRHSKKTFLFGHIIPFFFFDILCLLSMLVSSSARGSVGDGDLTGRIIVNFILNDFMDVVTCFLNIVYDFLGIGLPSLSNSYELLCSRYFHVRQNCPFPRLLFIFLVFGIILNVFDYLYEWISGKFYVLRIILTMTRKMIIVLIVRKKRHELTIYYIYWQSFGLF